MCFNQFKQIKYIRYIGRGCGLYPIDQPLKALIIDEIIDSIEDIIALTMPLIKMQFKSNRETNDTLEQKKKDLTQQLLDPKTGGLPMWFSKFECRLQENSQRSNVNLFMSGRTLKG